MKKQRVSFLLLVLYLSLLTGCQAADAWPEYVNDIYEPSSAVSLPPTIIGLAQASFEDDIASDAPPQGMAARIDSSLNVYTMDGEMIATALEDYLKIVTTRAVPTIYIANQATSDALCAFIESTDYQDLTVAATPKNSHLVASVTAAYPLVRGMIDYSNEVTTFTPDTLDAMVAQTNASHSKIILLNQAASDAATVRYLQQRLMSVFVLTDDTPNQIAQQMIHGVNGILTPNARIAYDVLAMFTSDNGEAVLLRPSFVIGHRGMPALYPENTMHALLAAADAGAAMVETDIYLSADNQIFCIHDSNLTRLFNRSDITDVESLTLAELQSLPMDEATVQTTNHTKAANSTNGTIHVSSDDRIPSLREVFTAFQDRDEVLFIEIKSMNLEIVPALRALAEEMDMTGRMVVITFIPSQLEKMAQFWPEMSLGCLGTDNAKSLSSYNPKTRLDYKDHATLIGKGRTGRAVERLYQVIGQYNGTYNPSYKPMMYDLVRAARHRGLTCWPWTYNDIDAFSTAFLKGIHGLTTNFALWSTDTAIAFTMENSSGYLTLQSGEKVLTTDYQTIEGNGLTLYRTRQELVVDGIAYGYYWLYDI